MTVFPFLPAAVTELAGHGRSLDRQHLITGWDAGVSHLHRTVTTPRPQRFGPETAAAAPKIHSVLAIAMQGSRPLDGRAVAPESRSTRIFRYSANLTMFVRSCEETGVLLYLAQRFHGTADRSLATIPRPGIRDQSTPPAPRPPGGSATCR